MIVGGQSESSKSLVTLLNILFPECNVQIVPKGTGNRELAWASRNSSAARKNESS
jgi:hypothetical protein